MSTLPQQKRAKILPYDVLPKQISENLYQCQGLKHDEPQDISAFALGLYYPLYFRNQILDESWRWVYQWSFGQFRYKMYMIENHFYLQCYCGNFLKNKKEIQFLQPSKNTTYVAFGFKEGILYMFLRVQSRLASAFIEIQIPSMGHNQKPQGVIPVFNQIQNWQIFGGYDKKFQKADQWTAKLIN